MNKIQAQAAKLGQILFGTETTATYKKALLLTWELVKETGRLVWLMLCLIFVFTAWVSNTSLKAGRDYRAWLNSIEQPTTNHILASASQALLEAGKTGAAKALSSAKTQLGMETEVEPEAIEVKAYRADNLRNAAAPAQEQVEDAEKPVSIV